MRTESLCSCSIWKDETCSGCARCAFGLFLACLTRLRVSTSQSESNWLTAEAHPNNSNAQKPGHGLSTGAST